MRRSREHPDRPGLQRRLEQAIDQANGLLAPVLAASLVLTLGDEFQGLLVKPEAGLDVVLAVEGELRPARLRYALGWGRLSTPLRGTAIGMDGPCFHRAREAMAVAKRRDLWIAVGGFGEETDATLNGILGLIGAVRSTWTPIQAETAAKMRDLNVQAEVAAARGVALATVHKALRGALYGPVVEAEQAVRRILRTVPQAPSPTPASPERRGGKN